MHLVLLSAGEAEVRGEAVVFRGGAGEDVLVGVLNEYGVGNHVVMGRL